MSVSVAVAFLAAAAQPAATVSSQAQAPVAKPKRVCHVEEAVTGSLTPKRVCVTVPQADASAPKTPQDSAGGQPQPSPSGSGN
jgi:hypothetical protein